MGAILLMLPSVKGHSQHLLRALPKAVAHRALRAPVRNWPPICSQCYTTSIFH